MKLKRAKRIFMHGIGGSGMRGLAYLLASEGIDITGTDACLNDTDCAKGLQPYRVKKEARAETLMIEADLVIYSDAISDEHPLRQKAALKGIRAIAYQEAVGEYSKDLKVIAVAGTHGKSSTTAMLAHIMVEADLDPTALVGAGVNDWKKTNARKGKSEYFIVEADEYRRHFLTLSPQHLIVTSIDFDHPDYFKNLDDVIAVFDMLLKKVNKGGWVVCPKEVKEGAGNKIGWPQNTVTVDGPQEIELNQPGSHMRMNAGLAIALAGKLGVDENKTREYLKYFRGIDRRFEIMGKINQMETISDYGHHPKAIDATLKATAEEYGNDKKLLVIFEPHTTERWEKFADQFVKVLSQSIVAGIIACPIYKARDTKKEKPISTYKQLKETGKDVWQIENYKELKPMMKTLSSEFDIALAFTAGELDGRLRKIVE